MDDAGARDIADLATRAGGGDRVAAEELLPEVYDALHALARRKMASEPSGHTLQPTALVSEAYMRVVGDEDKGWNGAGHFYAAAAEAMRRILIERARRYSRIKHGGGRQRIPLVHADEEVGRAESDVDLLALDEALTELKKQDERAARIVTLRYFAGLSNERIAEVMGISERTVRREWGHARLWLLDRMGPGASHT